MAEGFPSALLSRTHTTLPCLYYGASTVDAPRSEAEVARLARAALRAERKTTTETEEETEGEVAEAESRESQREGEAEEIESQPPPLSASSTSLSSTTSAPPPDETATPTPTTATPTPTTATPATTPTAMELCLPRLLNGALLLVKNGRVLHNIPLRSVIFCCNPKGQENMAAVTVTLTREAKAQMVEQKRSAAALCHLFRFEDARLAGMALSSLSTGFDFLTKLAAYQEAAKADGAGEESTAAHPLQFLFRLTMGLAEQDKAGAYVFCPYSKGTFRTRVDRHRRFTLSLSQSSFQPMAFERASRIGISMVTPWRPASEEEGNYQWLDVISVEWSDSTSFTMTAQWPDSPEFSRAFKDTSVSMVLAVDVVVVGLQEPVRIELSTKVRMVRGSDLLWIQGKKDASEQAYALKLQAINRPDGHVEYAVESLRQCAASARQSYLERLNRVMKQLVTDKGDEDGGDDADADADCDDAEEDEQGEPVDELAGFTGVSGRGHVEINLTDALLEQWSAVLGRWDSTPRSRIASLARKGVPDRLRAQVWSRLACPSEKESSQLEQAYKYLLGQDSPSKSVILWDLERTFPAHEKYREKNGEGQQQLFRVNAAYAVYDEEIGYCQGLSFITAVLLLHMPEEMAFQVFVSMMQTFELRELYKMGFENLTLRFYQLERLVEDMMPDLHQHLREQRIEVHMFASQWFLTLFATKFSLTLVFRIFDFFLAEGFNTIFQVSLALLKTCKKELLSRSFEDILAFFRLELPDIFRDESSARSLILRAAKMKVTSRKLAKYEKDYLEMKAQEALEEDPMTILTRENEQLKKDKVTLEAEVEDLSRKLLETQTGMQRTLDGTESAAEKLAIEKDKLQEKYDRLKTDASAESQQLEEEVRQVKELYRKTLAQADADRGILQTQFDELTQQHISMETRKDREIAELTEQVKRLQAIASASEADANAVDLQRTVHDLELELAQVKFQLVETDCELQGTRQRLSAASASPSEEAGSKRRVNLPGWLKR